MAIDGVGYAPETLDGLNKDDPSKSEVPMSLSEVTEKFADSIEITSAEIIPFFASNQDKNRLCVAIPVSTEDEATRKQELGQIGKSLRFAIFQYTGLKRSDSIGASLECLIGEATSDIAKHTMLRERFDKILVMVTRDNLDISFHMVNPARADVNLHAINQPDSQDEYDTEMHGHNLAVGLGKDLLKNGCQSVTDKSHLVRDGKNGTIAVERDISIVGIPSRN